MTKFAVGIDANEASRTNLQEKLKHNHKMRNILLLSMLAFLPAVGMNAQNPYNLRMYGEDITMSEGEKPELVIYLDFTQDDFYHLSNFTIVLPEGFSVTKNRRGEFVWTGNVDRQTGMAINNKFFEEGNYFNILTQANELIYTPLDENDRWYIKCNIEADETVTTGTYTVTVKNIAMTSNELVGGTHDAKEYSLPDFTFNIIYTKPAKTYDLTVTDATMATMYLDYAVSVPDDVLGVYYVNGKTGNTLNMAELTEIPANTGVIVMANPGTYTFTETTNSVADVDNNYLKGVNEATAVSELGSTIYTLGRGKNAGLLGFHKYTGSTLAAHKAYMTDETGNVNAFNLAFPDGTTFINRLSIDSKTQEIYDLQGRRVEHPTSGVYIINGVKTVVK